MEREKPATKNPREDWELDLSELEAALKIDEHGLDEAVTRQPEIFYRVSKHLTRLISRRDFAKQKLDEVKAHADTEVRDNAPVDEKLREKDVDAQVKLHPEVVSATREQHRLNYAVGIYEALKDAFRQRGFALGHLTELWVGNYFGEVSQGKSSRRINEEGDARYREERRRNPPDHDRRDVKVKRVSD